MFVISLFFLKRNTNTSILLFWLHACPARYFPFTAVVQNCCINDGKLPWPRWSKPWYYHHHASLRVLMLEYSNFLTSNVLIFKSYLCRNIKKKIHTPPHDCLFRVLWSVIFRCMVGTTTALISMSPRAWWRNGPCLTFRGSCCNFTPTTHRCLQMNQSLNSSR